MKKLILVRHAKSSWKHPDLTDMDRPLNNRGKRDAPFIGKLLFECGKSPDLLVSSPAVRAFTTAKTIAKEIEYPVKNIIKSDLLYHGGIREMLAVIRKTDEKIDLLMIFGHNPGFTTLCNYLSGSSIDNIPTCGIAEIDLEIESWSETDGGKGNLVKFEYPKKYPR